MRRIVLVGEAPSRTSDPTAPLMGHATRAKVAGLLGITTERYAALPRFNLLTSWPGKAGKGDEFPIGAAREAANGIVDRFYRTHEFVLLGKRVAKAFQLPGSTPYFSWQAAPIGGSVVVIPHPSGINRWHNDELNRRRLVRFMRKLGREIE